MLSVITKVFALKSYKYFPVLLHLYVTVHRILATLVMPRARHVRTVRQKMQELSRNDRVRILLIKNFLCVRQHGRNNSLRAGKY